MHARMQRGVHRAWLLLGALLGLLLLAALMLATLSHAMAAGAAMPAPVVAQAAAVATVLGWAEYLPIVNLGLDLLNGSASTDRAALLYDVFQAIAGVYMLALALRWLAARTPWTWDDGPTRALVGYLIRGLRALAEIITASGGEKPRMPPGVR